jgi:hypothetical protein
LFVQLFVGSTNGGQVYQFDLATRKLSVIAEAQGGVAALTWRNTDVC